MIYRSQCTGDRKATVCVCNVVDIRFVIVSASSSPGNVEISAAFSRLVVERNAVCIGGMVLQEHDYRGIRFLPAFTDALRAPRRILSFFPTPPPCLRVGANPLDRCDSGRSPPPPSSLVQQTEREKLHK